MNDHIRPGQIQSGSACLQWNQKYRHGSFIKITYQLNSFLLGCLAGDLIPFNMGRFQILFQQFQHRCKLWKNQHTMAAFNSLANQFHTSFTFGWTAVIRLIKQWRITAHLSESRQLSKNLQFILNKFRIRLFLQHSLHMNNLSVI